MQSWTLYVTSLLSVAIAMFTLALVLQARMHKQLIVYSKGILRYYPDERAVEEHLIAHGIKAEQAGKIVLAAQQRRLHEEMEALVKQEQNQPCK